MVKEPKIPEVVIRRLTVYHRVLDLLMENHVEVVSSQELGQRTGFTPAQVRKDLAYFGEFGTRGLGYDVKFLHQTIAKILGLDRETRMGLIGAGNLGTALAHYNIYRRENFKIVAIFDNDPQKIGKTIANHVIQPMSNISAAVKELGIKVMIITVPAAAAQEVANAVVQAGIKGIVNFAPIKINVPEGVRVHYADLTAEMLSLIYYLHD